MAYTLYGTMLSAPTYKVALMLSLCGESFSYRAIDLAKGAHKTPDYLAINRYGQVPALKHDDQPVIQSNIILDYLAEQTGKFRGDGMNRWRAREWLAWEADRLAPNVNRTRFYTRFAPTTDATIQKYFRDLAEVGLKVLDAALAGKNWLAGDAPTIADIGCFSCIPFAEEGKLALEPFANIASWRTRLTALSGFKLPYDLLPKGNMG